MKGGKTDRRKEERKGGRKRNKGRKEPTSTKADTVPIILKPELTFLPPQPLSPAHTYTPTYIYNMYIQTKIRSALDEGLRSSIAETRAVLSQLKALETTAHEQHADIRHTIANNQVRDLGLQLVGKKF
jgi:hypothetical protein